MPVLVSGAWQHYALDRQYSGTSCAEGPVLVPNLSRLDPKVQFGTLIKCSQFAPIGQYYWPMRTLQCTDSVCGCEL